VSVDDTTPWYRRCYRWGQTNLTEIDPTRYDAAWWRQHWKRTQIQGVIVNAGGIVAYYPSRFPLHHRASHLGERDLYGEIVADARAERLAVLARMDSNRADEIFYVEHPDWFAVDANGRPYRAEDKYVACVSSPYYDVFLPDVLAEIVERSHPDGFTDNSWSGLERDRICYCEHCARRFRDTSGHALPRAHTWDDPAYRQWIAWSYARRVEVWDLNNRVVQAAGGPDCLWIGMNSGDILGQARRLRDYRAIGERAPIIFLDSQYRTSSEQQPRGFPANSEAGKLIHGLIGWDALIPESTALYQAGQPTFRVGSKPEPEVRLWAVEGFAGGIQPWWHHIGAYHDDRRQYQTAEPMFRWHAANEQYLVDRLPVATVGMVWSQANVDFFGRDEAVDRVLLPQLGMRQALIDARIPYLPVHADHVDRDAAGLAVLILPNIGALSEAQCASIRRFVNGGGGLIASGQTSRFDEWGDPRPDFALADLFGAHATGSHHGSSESAARTTLDSWARHTYLRLSPELRGGVYGPTTDTEPPIEEARHPAFNGFDGTDIVPFGGRLDVVHPDAGVQMPLMFVPPFPMYPPETSWMRHPTSSLPALVLNESAGGRVGYLAADLDRCFGRDNLPDHGRLLANLIRWAAHDDIPLEVVGPGMFDCHLYRQPGRLILHVVNLTNPGTWRPPVHELIPSGPANHARQAAGGRGQGFGAAAGGRSGGGRHATGWLGRLRDPQRPGPRGRRHRIGPDVWCGHCRVLGHSRRGTAFNVSLLALVLPQSTSLLAAHIAAVRWDSSLAVGGSCRWPQAKRRL